MSAYTFNSWDELEATLGGRRAAYRVQGNLAPKIPQEISEREAVSQRHLRQNVKRDPKDDQSLITAYRQKEHLVTKKRLRDCILVVVGILIVASMFGFILFRHAQISQQNFQNNARVRENLALEQETSQINERLIGQTNLDYIYSEAVDRLGMQIPGKNQIIQININKSDQLITSSALRSSDISASDVETAKMILAQHYASLDSVDESDK